MTRVPRPPRARAGRLSPTYPVPAIDVGPVAYQQFHHVGLVPQDGNVQGRVVGDRVWGPGLSQGVLGFCI